MAITVNLAKKNYQEQHTKAVLSRMERMSGHRVEIFRSDQGGEYTSQNLSKQLYEIGVHQEYSDTKMAFQNGLAEVIGEKLVSMVRAMLVRSGVPMEYWSWAVMHATWIHNRVPLRRQQGRTTPIAELTGQRPNLSRARIFGCEGWVAIRYTTKAKLSRRAERAVHLGVSMKKKAWVFMLWDSKKIVESRMHISTIPFKEENGDGIKLRAETFRRAFDLTDDDEIQDEIEDGDGADLVGANQRDEHGVQGGGVDEGGDIVNEDGHGENGGDRGAVHH